ncbi:MAG: hypothetical protein M3273_01760 [Actinomycetota bacterium]|nr:hypothetical protein [Actinomycetota bacterium]
MRPLAAVLVGLLLLTAACGSDEPEEAAVPSRGGGVPDEVTGVVIEVDSTGVDEIESFVLKDGDETYDVLIADDVDYGFALGHLNEHLTTGDPVTVELEVRDGDLYALSILDA